MIDRPDSRMLIPRQKGTQKGFSGTKTREIAVRAGVSEALIFKHFPSKEDLYAAILAEESPVPGLLSKVRLLAEQQKYVEVFRPSPKPLSEESRTPN